MLPASNDPNIVRVDSLDGIIHQHVGSADKHWANPEAGTFESPTPSVIAQPSEGSVPGSPEPEGLPSTTSPEPQEVEPEPQEVEPEPQEVEPEPQEVEPEPQEVEPSITPKPFPHVKTLNSKTKKHLKQIVKLLVRGESEEEQMLSADRLTAHLKGAAKSSPDMWIPAEWFSGHIDDVEGLQTTASFPRPLLFLALAKSNHHAVQALVTAGANVDVRIDEDNNTLLHLFARAGGAACAAHCCHVLLRNNADQAATNAQGNRPIHLAIMAVPRFIPVTSGPQPHMEVAPGVKHFVEAAGKHSVVEMAMAPSVAGKKKKRNTPVDAGDADPVDTEEPIFETRRLVDAGNAVTWETPLHLAVKKKDPVTVRYLLGAGGADPGARDRDGNTPLHEVVGDDGKTDYAVIDVLLKAGADLEARNASEATPFKHALQHGRLKVAMELVHVGANPKYADDNGATAHHLIATQGNGNFYHTMDLCKLPPWRFPPSHVSLAASTNAGDTPLHWATRLQQHRLVQVLLHQGSRCVKNRDAVLNRGNEEGKTPLHVAVETQGCEKRLVDRLLRCPGVDVNAASSRDGRSPLHLAAALGRSTVVNKLLKKGCNVNQGDRTGLTPLHVAVEAGQKSVAKQLLRHGLSHPMGGTTVNGRNQLDGRSALHYAASAPVLRVDIIKMLVQQGGNPNLMDAQGNTPFHLAAKRGMEDDEDRARTGPPKVKYDYKWEAIDVMLKMGGRLDVKNSEGMTPSDLILKLHPYTPAEFKEHSDALWTKSHVVNNWVVA